MLLASVAILLTAIVFPGSRSSSKLTPSADIAEVESFNNSLREVLQMCQNGGRTPAAAASLACPQIYSFACCSAADSEAGRCKPDAIYFNVL
jgi:hypothetical protein